MPEPSGHDPLGARRQLVAVLRVVVGSSGRVLYGDVVDPDTDDRTIFVGSSGVAAALDKWVQRVLRRSDRRTPPAADPDRPTST